MLKVTARPIGFTVDTIHGEMLGPDHQVEQAEYVYAFAAKTDALVCARLLNAGATPERAGLRNARVWEVFPTRQVLHV